MRQKLTVADGVVAGVCLVLAGLLFLLPLCLPSRGGVLSVRYAGTEETEEYRLSEDRVLHLEHNGYTLTVEIRDGAARVTESSCPDGFCRRGGPICRDGDTLLCAPAGVLLTVRAPKRGESDAVVG